MFFSPHLCILLFCPRIVYHLSLDPSSLEEVTKCYSSFEQGMKIKILISILSVDASKLAENHKLYEKLFDVASSKASNDLWVVVSAYLVYKRYTILLHKLHRSDSITVNPLPNQNLLEISQFMNSNKKIVQNNFK